jgi:hypothetical protein
MDVPGKIQIQAAPADLRPRLHLLRGSVQQRVPFEHGHLAGLEPFAIEIPFDAPAAADVLGAELGRRDHPLRRFGLFAGLRRR